MGIASVMGIGYPGLEISLECPLPSSNYLIPCMINATRLASAIFILSDDKAVFVRWQRLDVGIASFFLQQVD